MKESKIFTERNLTEIVHYVYRVTIDDKYYIGKRTGLLNDLHTGRYETSSNLVHEKLQNGITFSKIKILKVFSTEKEALEFEKRILMRVNARTNPKFLNQHNGGGNYTLKQHTEKAKEKMSKSQKEYYNTEEGIKRREHQSNKRKEYYNPETEEGRRNREKYSEKMKEYYNPETEEGRKNREINSKSKKEYYNPDTEEGRKNRENVSKGQKRRFNPNTESGRFQLEENRRRAKVGAQRSAEASFQKKKNNSILKELIFDEFFIRKNFLILDDKNNPRFLSSVYSKLSGYCESSIVKQKREGKLSFLYGIKSIYISEEQENAKIKEIEAIIKSMNKKKNN